MILKEELSFVVEEATENIMSMLVKVIESGTFSEAVEQTQSIVNRLGTEILQRVCTEVDEAYNAGRNKKEVIIRNAGKTRRLLTTMGEVTLHRRLYYEKSKKRYFFAADEMLGIEKRSRIETGLQARLIKSATLSSYGKAAEAYSSNVSRQTVFNLVRKLDCGKMKIKPSEQKRVDELYIEADEDHIHLKNGKNAEVRLVYVHEGYRNVCRGRRALIAPKYFVSVGTKNDKIWDDVEEYVCSRYEIAGSKIYLSGDGASWIKNGLGAFPRAIYRPDKFHIYKSVTNIASGDKVLRGKIISALFEKDYVETRKIYDCVMRTEKSKSERMGIRNNFTYIENNFDELEMGGETCCSAESHVSHILSARMSSRPMAWSKTGARKIAGLRAFYFNGGNFAELLTTGENDAKKKVKNTKEKYNRHNLETDGIAGTYACPSGKVVGLDGITNGTSEILRAIVRSKTL